MPPFDLTGQKILITGASQGIGESCAMVCAEMGATILLVARNQEKLQAVAAKLPGIEHQVIPFDLNNLEQIEDIFITAVADGKKLTGLVHAAGIGPALPLKVLSVAQLQQVFTLNYFSFMMLVKNFVKKKNSIGGSVVGISSVAGSAGWQGLSAYSGSKGAMDASMRSLAIELSAAGFRFNTIVPSNIKTQLAESMMSVLSVEEISRLEKKQPLGFGVPENVAHAAAFLLSRAAEFITGTQLVVDGGYLAQ